MDDTDDKPVPMEAPSPRGRDAASSNHNKDGQAENEADGVCGGEPSGSNNVDPNTPRTDNNKSGRSVDGVTEVGHDTNDGDTEIDPAVCQGEVPQSLPQPEQEVLTVDGSVLDTLTTGFLQTFRPQVESSGAILDELMRNQRVLIETLEQENAKFQENIMLTELTELMTEARKYHSKLIHLRKEMVSLHEKSTKLKKRALKLQNNKMKQNLQKEQQRERELEQEKHLIAKPASRKTP